MAGQYTGQVSLEEFERSIDNLENFYGHITNLDYREQVVEYASDKTPLHELDKAQSKVWYAVQTTTHNSEGLFLTITVAREGTAFKIFRIDFTNFGQNIPSWLTQP